MSRILGLWPADVPREEQPPLMDLLLKAAGPRRTVEVAPLDADGRVRIVVRDAVRIVAAERGEWDGAARRAIAALFALGLGRAGT